MNTICNTYVYYMYNPMASETVGRFRDSDNPVGLTLR